MSTVQQQQRVGPPTNVLEGGDAVAAFRDAERAYWARYGLTPRERYVRHVGYTTTVRVLEVGEGPAILYVHGGRSVGSGWAPLVARLPGYRHIIVDRPGYGLSASMDYRTVDLRAFTVGVLTTVLHDLGIERAAVVGNGAGGLAAFWLAADHPERVSALVQAGAPCLVPGMVTPGWMRVRSMRGVNRLVSRAQRPDPAGAADALRGLGHDASVDAGRIPVEFYELSAAADRLPWAGDRLTELERLVGVRGPRRKHALTGDALAHIDQPTLLLWGMDDVFGDADVGRLTADELPDGSLVALEDCGHFPWFDRPTKCADEMVGFLTSRGIEPRRIEYTK